MAVPAGDQDNERMLGARPVARPVSARIVGLEAFLKAVERLSFFIGREVFGGAIVARDFSLGAAFRGFEGSGLEGGRSCACGIEEVRARLAEAQALKLIGLQWANAAQDER